MSFCGAAIESLMRERREAGLGDVGTCEPPNLRGRQKEAWSLVLFPSQRGESFALLSIWKGSRTAGRGVLGIGSKGL